MKIIDEGEARILVEGILSNEISGEYAWLDFKLEFKNNPEELVHDILCLSNTRHNGIRFIIYGVENASWKLKGLSNDLVANDIYTIINNQVWNHKPIVLVDHVHVDGMKFGFIAVADAPTKPHYLRKPYKKIPSGAVYIRQGDTNTPFKKGTEIRSVEDGELELMFRERFGIDKPLLEKCPQLPYHLSNLGPWLRVQPHGPFQSLLPHGPGAGLQNRRRSRPDPPACQRSGCGLNLCGSPESFHRQHRPG